MVADESDANVLQSQPRTQLINIIVKNPLNFTQSDNTLPLEKC